MAIKYLGSKRLLLEEIGKHFESAEIKSVVDVFSGTARVGHHLKKMGKAVISNDIAEYARVVASCYVKADKEIYEKEAAKLIKEYNDTPIQVRGYFTKIFCEKSKFFMPKNGMRVDYIREDLENRDLDPIIKDIVLTSLMEAADRVDSTCGIQMAYLKKWAPRAHNDLVLKMPELALASPAGNCEVFKMDALELAKEVKADAAYLDPPYNTHSYLGNYHIWETLCLWDKPEVYGVACKRVDTKERKSDFNFKKKSITAFETLVNTLDVKKIVVSFNDEGFISKEEMEKMLSVRGSVITISKDYKRYVGAQIGIHSPDGKKVGEVSHLKNKEFIFVVECNK